MPLGLARCRRDGSWAQQCKNCVNKPYLNRTANKIATRMVHDTLRVQSVRANMISISVGNCASDAGGPLQTYAQCEYAFSLLSVLPQNWPYRGRTVGDFSDAEVGEYMFKGSNCLSWGGLKFQPFADGNCANNFGSNTLGCICFARPLSASPSAQPIELPTTPYPTPSPTRFPTLFSTCNDDTQCDGDYVCDVSTNTCGVPSKGTNGGNEGV